MRAIASDTTTPTSINGENRLRCVDRVLNGLRRSLRIITYLFLFLKIHVCYVVQVPKTPFFRHSNAKLTTIVEAFRLSVVESCASHPKKVPVLFASLGYIQEALAYPVAGH